MVGSAIKTIDRTISEVILNHVYPGRIHPVLRFKIHPLVQSLMDFI